MNAANLDQALQYLARGWAVFPLHTVNEAGECSCGKLDCPDAGKHPRTGRGHKNASRDEAQINEWFGWGAPPSNIGIATGAISGITVIDVDVHKGGAET